MRNGSGVSNLVYRWRRIRTPDGEIEQARINLKGHSIEVNRHEGGQVTVAIDGKMYPVMMSLDDVAFFVETKLR